LSLLTVLLHENYCATQRTHIVAGVWHVGHFHGGVCAASVLAPAAAVEWPLRLLPGVDGAVVNDTFVRRHK
jgi:hypothetical protein